MVKGAREYDGQRDVSRRYYISSLPCNEAKTAHGIRSHRQIENSRHWCFDVVFNEAQSRARARNAAKNPGTLRAVCVNLIKQIPGKLSMKSKRFQAALNNDFLIMALKIQIRLPCGIGQGNRMKMRLRV